MRRPQPGSLAGRPRRAAALSERLFRLGPEGLDDAELLALATDAADGGRCPAAFGHRVLAACGSLAGAAAREPRALARAPGVGRRRAVRLVAAFELGRRLRARVPGRRPRLAGASDVYAAFGPVMEHLTREVFRVALLDAQNGLLGDQVVSVGTLTASLVDPRAVFVPALLEPAAAVVLLHNHPSGDPTPSREDIALTRQLASAARVLGLRLHDHLVIGAGRFVSLVEQGML